MSTMKAVCSEYLKGQLGGDESVVEFREKAAEMGFDGILLKPITGEKLSRIFGGRIAAGVVF